MNKIKNIIIILAAGKGTRMESDLPKVLHTINNMPMIKKVINTSKQLKPYKIIVIVGYKKELVIESINDNTIEYVIQKEQKGTGHAIMQCLPSIENFKGNILILSGDVPLIQTQTLIDFIKSHNENKSGASLISTDLDEPGGYGRIIKNKKQQLTGIVEYKDASDDEKSIKEINSGIYIFNVETLKSSLSLITNNNAQKEYYLTEVFDFIDSDTTFVKKIKRSNEILGVNNLEELNELENYTFNEK